MSIEKLDEPRYGFDLLEMFYNESPDQGVARVPGAAKAMIFVRYVGKVETFSAAMRQAWMAVGSVTGITANDPYALAATESKADINSGTNTPSGTAFALTHRQNPSIDLPQIAYASINNAVNTVLLTYTQPLEIALIASSTRTSIQPKFIQPEDLDTSKTPSAVSHKIFLHFGYAWDEDEDVCWAPFLGLGGEVEFSGNNCGTYSALSQWGIWLKGGVSWS